MKRKNVITHTCTNCKEKSFNDQDELLRDIIKLNSEAPIQLQQVKAKKNGNFININVFRDDHVYGGTKLRVVIPFINQLKSDGYEDFIYAGPSTGFAIVALSLACFVTKTRAHLFIQYSGKKNILLRLLDTIGQPYVNYSLIKSTLKDIQSKAEDFFCDLSKSNKKPYLFRFGLDDEHFRDLFYNTLCNTQCNLENISSNKISNLQEIEPKRIWLVGGSTLLYQILIKIFPNSKFNIVQIGKTIWDDQIDLSRTVKYVAPEKFFKDAQILPPYPSVPTYDAKLWRFVEQHGEDDDFIWNVASEKSIELILNEFQSKFKEYKL